MSFRSFCAALLVVVTALGLRAGPAHAQQSQADCAPGWIFANGQCEEQRGGNGGGSNDAACQATAEFRYCRASVYIGCHNLGSGYACRLLQLSSQNPRQFQQIMSAQRACTYGNRQACAFLQQFRGVYF